jgi:hypothetical protein
MPGVVADDVPRADRSDHGRQRCGRRGTCRENNAGITLPPGFCATVFADEPQSGTPVRLSWKCIRFVIFSR